MSYNQTKPIYINVTERPFAAKGDGSDDHSAFQAALDSVGNVGGAIFVPPTSAQYTVHKPLRIKRDDTKIEGAHQNASRIAATNYIGPLLVFGPPATPITRGPGLFAGSPETLSFSMSTAQVEYLDLRESRALDINGTAHFCVEFPYQHRVRVSAGEGAIISSSGKRLFSETPTTAFSIAAINVSLSGADDLRAILKVGGTAYTLTANNVLTLNVHKDICLDYDGTTIRLFVNGSVVASQAASGTVTQKVSEDVILGGQSLIWPQKSLVTKQPTGYVGPVHISKTSRHTSTYTPSTSTFSTDTNTLLYIGWDVLEGDMLVGGKTWITGSEVTTYLTNHQPANPDVLGGPHLQHIWLQSQNGAAIVLNGADNIQLDNITVDSCRDGLLILRGADFGLYRHLDFQGDAVAGRFGILDLAGRTVYESIRCVEFAYGLVSPDASIQDYFCSGDNLVEGAMFQAVGDTGSVSIQAPFQVDASGASFISALTCSSVNSLVASGIIIDSLTSTNPPIHIDCGGDELNIGTIVKISNLIVGINAAAPEVLTFTGTAPKSFELINRTTHGPGGASSPVPLTTAATIPIIVEPENTLGSAIVTMSDTDIVVTPQQYLSKTITLEESPALTDWRSVTLPTWASPVRHIYNHTSQPLLIKTAAGKGVPVHPQRNAIVRCDGTDIVRAGATDTFYNVVEFGAVGDASLSSHGGTDDTAAIQRTIDIATAAGGGTVFFPVGVYKILKPLKVDAQFVVLQGENTNAILSFIDSWGINIFLAAGSTGQFDASTKFGTSLYASDSRPAIRLGHFVDIAPTGPVQYIVNLSHVPGGSQFDGLTAICFEFRMKINSVPFDADPNAPWYFLTSAGARSINDPDAHGLFGLAITEDLKIRADIRPVTLAGATSFSASLTLGVTYTVKINYDSATDGVIRIYINGVFDGSSVGVTSGGLTQRPHEEVFLGGSQGSFPGGFGSAPPDMWIDSLRISDISREVGAYTPSATKLLEDGNTMFLFNQEERNDFLFRGRSRSKRISPPVTQFSDTWFTIETSNRTDERHNNGVKDLTIRSYGGSAIYMTGQLGWFIEHVRLMECWEGIYAHDNCYNGRIHRVWGTAGFYGGRFGVCYLAALATIQDCEFHFRYGVAVGGTADIINCYFNTDDPVIAIYCGEFADSVLVRGCALSDENFGPLFQTQLYVAGARTVIVEGTSLECGNSTKPNIIVDGADQENTPLTECLEVTGCIFKYQAGTPENIQLISPTKNPVLVRDKRGIINTGSFVEIPVTTSRTCPLFVEPRHADGHKVLDFPSDANLTLTADAWSYHWIKFTDIAHTLSVARNVSVPKFEGWTRVVENATTQDLTVKTDAGTGIVVPVGNRRLLGCDGTNIIDVLAGLAAATFTAGHDLSGTATIQNVEAITGRATGTLNVYGASTNTARLRTTAATVAWTHDVGAALIGIEDQTGDTATAALGIRGHKASASATGGNVTGGLAFLTSGQGKAGDGSDDGDAYVETYSGYGYRVTPTGAGKAKQTLSQVEYSDWTGSAGSSRIRSGHGLGTSTNSTSANQTIATIPIPATGTSWGFCARVVERVGTTQTEMAQVVQVAHWNGSSFAAGSGADGIPADLSTNSLALKAQISSSNIVLKLTPVSASAATHSYEFEFKDV